MKAYRKLKLEKSNTDVHDILLVAYCMSPFRDYESFLRIKGSLNEDDIHLILEHYFSKFVLYELPLGIFSFKDISEVDNTKGDRPGTIQLEYDEVSMKTKPVSKHFTGARSTIGTLRFDKESFFNTILRFEPYWDYKPHHHAYTSEKVLNLSTINKTPLKCNILVVSVVKLLREPILFS